MPSNGDRLKIHSRVSLGAIALIVSVGSVLAPATAQAEPDTTSASSVSRPAAAAVSPVVSAARHARRSPKTHPIDLAKLAIKIIFHRPLL